METSFTYFVFNLTFNSSVEFSTPFEVGLNAQQFSFPANVDEDSILLHITFVKFDVESQKNMNMTDADFLNYTKSTFLGTSKPAETTKIRQIMEKNSFGEILKTKIPTPSNIEIHLITLPDNTKFVIGFKSVNSINTSELEKIIVEITNSLKIN